MQRELEKVIDRLAVAIFDKIDVKESDARAAAFVAYREMTAIDEERANKRK